MANRISELGSGSVSSGTGGAVESVQPAKPVRSAASGSSAPSGNTSHDSVHITESARTIATLSQAVQDTPEVDNVRVGNLQQAIASGGYSVDANKVAARMLQLEQDLAGNTQ